MIITTTTLVISAILFLLAVIASVATPFFRKTGLSEAPTPQPSTDELHPTSPLPAVSIIITAHDNSDELKRHLPVILSQQYPTEFQVIVVADKGDSETEDILKLLSADEHLYYTMIPSSSRYMSRKKLAITIGVKAAKHEWIMLIEPTAEPQSDKWLMTMARNCQNDTDLVVGYSRYADDAHIYQRFERMLTQCYSLHEAQYGTAYRHFGSNLMFRKSLFMKQEGFRSNLHLVRGEYDFLVNDIARKGNTATETSSLAHIVEDAPTHKAWIYHHMYYLESRKSLQRGFAHRLLFNVDQSLLHISVIADLLLIAASIALSQWLLTAASAIAIVLHAVLSSCWMAKRSKALGEHIPAFMALPLQLSVVWHHIKYAVNHRFADKLDFTTHKL